MNAFSLIVLFIILQLINTDFSFISTDYFATHQVRLQPSLTSSMFLYTLPIQPITNTGSAALALSGYDFAPNPTLSFSIQLSYDPDANSYQIIFNTNNGTQVYFINYFLIEVGSSALNWIYVRSYCFNSTVNTNNAQNLNRNESINFVTQILANSNDSVRVVPYITSATIYGANTPNFYFNISSSQAINQTYNISIQLYHNYSSPISGCIAVVIVKETSFKNQPLLAYTYQPLYNVRNGANTLSNAIKKQFQISYFFGPTIQPKCVVSFRAFLIDGKNRQSFNFDISQSIITGSSSNSYLIDFAVLCIGYVTCPSPTDQFYPLIANCQPPCNIDNCLTCSSSTSCLNCNISFYIDSLSRCSPCIVNCLSCNDGKTCKTCALGYYYANQICQQCALYCLECIVGLCTRCADGYTPNATNCVSCQVVMPRCLKCSGPTLCITCVQTYVFFSNQAQCVTCNSMMPNCLTCNWPNNCLTCMPNYYLYSFYQCYLCTYKVQSCCANYVGNCSVCASNTTCSVCLMGWYLNGNQTCTSCSQNWENCVNCDKSSCFSCQKGYFLNNNTCVMCSTVIPSCKSCSNTSYCQLCQPPLIFGDGQCINCPIWPLKSLYYLQVNNGSQCKPCSQLNTQCSLCSKEGSCLECRQTYYLSNNDCVSCNNNTPFCVSCRNGNSCSICQSGYFLNISNNKQCLACSSILSNCLSCVMKLNASKKIVYSCSVCLSEYYTQLDQCLPCNNSLKNCLKCIDSSTCSECEVNYYPSSGGKCLSCSQLMTGCLKCSSSSKCTQCAAGFILQGSYCALCQNVYTNCQICSMNKSLTCLRCSIGFFSGQNSTCQNCSSKYQFCTDCDRNKCFSCLSSFYLNASGACVRCDSAVSNCTYCDTSVKCRSCSSNFVLDIILNQCRSCSDVQQGCQECIQTLYNSTDIQCTSCTTNYLLTSQNNVSKCIQCQNIIPYCKVCISLTQCQSCQNTSFISQGKCSLCNSTLANCQLCSSNSTCSKCINGYVLALNGSCVACALQKLGADIHNTSHCKQCALSNDSFICITCDQVSYLSSDLCILCNSSIQNCQNCENGQNCIRCAKTYYLQSNATKCIKCQFANCIKCSKEQCLECQAGYFLSNNQCVICSSVIKNCSICTQNECSICNDGYFLNKTGCFPCSIISEDCVICDGPSSCLVSSPYSSSSRNKAISMGIGITGIIGSVILLGVLIFYIVRWRLAKKSEQEFGGSDTSRRMSEVDYPTNDIQIQKNLCQCCNLQKVSCVKLQLLCRDCDQMQERGDSHKIKKVVGKQPQDCIIQKSLQIESKYQERNSPIQKQKFMTVVQTKAQNNNESPTAKCQQTTRANNGNSSNQKISKRNKPNTIQKSRFYRDMF